MLPFSLRLQGAQRHTPMGKAWGHESYAILCCHGPALSPLPLIRQSWARATEAQTMHGRVEPHQIRICGECDSGDVTGWAGCRRRDAGSCQQAAGGSCIWGRHGVAPRGSQAACALAAAAVARVIEVDSVLRQHF